MRVRPLTALKYFTVVSKRTSLDLYLQVQIDIIPSVFGNVFSNSRAMSGSLRRAFISVMTFYISDIFL